ncbi:hypothetical protein [Sphingobium yanoikuyae]|jgi:hypothetical protein|uniref:hypothetical protein n=1 Tax=Sphingobium yanoikuyae TaxID=13690 RepID=UPI002FD931B9
MPKIEDIRQVVADALLKKGHGNRQFLDEMRAGQRDDSPFMIGAIVWAEHVRSLGRKD